MSRPLPTTAIADEVVALSGATTGFVVTNADFPHALAATPIAVAQGWPVYLADTEAGAAMSADGITDAVVLGGPDAVSASTEVSLKSALGFLHVTRLWGADRYATAVTVSMYGCDSAGLHWNGLALATGEDFPDALAGGVLQGVDSSVLLLTPSASLHKDVADVLKAQAKTIYEVRYLGGPSAISQTVRGAVAGILD